MLPFLSFSHQMKTVHGPEIQRVIWRVSNSPGEQQESGRQRRVSENTCRGHWVNFLWCWFQCYEQMWLVKLWLRLKDYSSLISFWLLILYAFHGYYPHFFYISAYCRYYPPIVDKKQCIFLADILHTKVIENKYKHDGTPLMAQETGVCLRIFNISVFWFLRWETR